jgi:hypothetical protein
MAQDIRKLFENDKKVADLKMSEGHEERFLQKLDKTSSEKFSSNGKATDKANDESLNGNSWSWMQIAAGLVILFGLGFGAFKFFNQDSIKAPLKVVETKTKSLEDVAPDLKKVEDYYVASINFELSKIKPTPETKELFDGYLERLEELNIEYKRVSEQLIEFGPDELTVDALINNLKLRLNLLNRLKEKLNEINTLEQAPEMI